MALWLCKAPCLESHLVNLPSPASSFIKLSLSFSRLAPSHSSKPLARVPSNPVWMFVLQFSHLHHSFTSQKYKEGNFLFSFLKCPMQDQALLKRMWPTVCGYCQHSMAAAPIPVMVPHPILPHPAVHGCIHHSIRRETAVFPPSGLATDCIMDYCNSYQISGQIHAHTRSFIQTHSHLGSVCWSKKSKAVFLCE